jgi:hypothetical protein
MYSNSLSPIARIGHYVSAALARCAALAIVAVSASGCALLSDQLDKAAEGAGKVVKQYCENVTVPDVREQVRAAINKYAAPHSVSIECADGNGPTLKSDEPASVAPEAE